MPYGMTRSNYEDALAMFKRMPPPEFVALTVNELRKRGIHHYADIGEAIAACRGIEI